MRDPTKRRIASLEHNVHLANGVERHTPTSVAPAGLMAPVSESDRLGLLERHKEVDAELRRTIGRPYYSENGFILYEGDCTGLLEKLKGSRVAADLILTSPPYNIGKEYEREMQVSEYVAWCSNWIASLYAIASENASFWLNVGYLEVPEKGLCVPIPYLIWDKSDFYLIQEVVWTYGAGVSAKRRLSPRNEKWLFFVKDRAQYVFNLDDIRDPNVKYPNQKKAGKFRCNPLGKNPSDVWEFPKVTTGEQRSSRERTGHPAQFPLGIVERIVKVSSNKFDVVLDPFAGSGSAGVAAAALSRVFVGFELRRDYCHMAVARFERFLDERENANRQVSFL